MSHRKYPIGRGLCNGLLASTILFIAAAPAVAQEARQRFDIPAQSASDALNTFSRQSGLRLLFPYELVVGKQTQSVSGELTVAEALEKLLAGSDLTYEITSSGTLLIRSIDDSKKSPAAAAASAKTTKLAQQGSDVLAAQKATVDFPSQRLELQEIVVTGSRLRLDVNDSPAPITVIGRSEIERSGKASVGQIVAGLPQNAGAPRGEFGFDLVDSAVQPNLRGLGVGGTLVLINGRRAVPSAAAQSGSFAANSFNLNTIPVAAVERIEVLTSGASAIYGSDAAGGVINVILRRNFSGSEVTARYSDFDASSAGERSIGGVTGFGGDRFRILLGGEVYDRDRMMRTDRDYSSAAGAGVFTPFFPRSSVPGNVESVSGNLPGLSSSFAAVPRGSNTTALQTSDFQATQGTLNGPIPITDFQDLYSAQLRRGAFSTFEYDLTPTLTLFSDALWSQIETTTSSPTLAFDRVRVPADNPYNPFGADVRVSFTFVELPDRFFSRTNDGGLTLGLKGMAENSDEWQVYASAGRSTLDYSDVGPNFGSVLAALASTDRATAVNPFSDGSGNTPDVLDGLLTSLNQQSISMDARTLAAQRTFTPFSIAGRDVKTLLGAEGTQEAIDYVRRRPADGRVAFDRSRDVYAAFLEASVPLIGGSDQQPLLEASFAARYTSYSESGSSLDPQFGLLWRPASSLLVRASYGTSFIAPTFSQSYFPETVVLNGANIFDPKLNATYLLAERHTGSNPNLTPQQAESMTAGVVWQPAASGFRAAVDFYRVRYTNQIRNLTLQRSIELEDFFPSLVRRDPTTNRIVSVTIQPINVSKIDTQGADLDLSWSANWAAVGSFDMSLRVTYVDEFEIREFPTVLSVDRADVIGNPLHLRAAGSLAYRRGPFDTAFTLRYAGSYANAAPNNVVTQPRIDSSSVLDWMLSYSLFDASTAGWGLKLTVGAENVFNKKPPLVNSAIGFDPAEGDPRGRIIYGTLSASF